MQLQTDSHKSWTNKTLVLLNEARAFLLTQKCVRSIMKLDQKSKVKSHFPSFFLCPYKRTLPLAFRLLTFGLVS
jgi:hypothetical protein